jgi:hypothetical protein
MATVTWKINGQDPAALGLSGLQPSYVSFAADTLTFTHAGAAWDADPLFAYGATITLTRHVDGGAGVKWFVGKVRRTPRFLGAEAESLSYEVAGPWDWLQRRALLQAQAVVLDPEVSTVPAAFAQGLSILGQNDAGGSLALGDALAAVLAGAAAAGVAVVIGEGFAHGLSWDEVADLTLADAVVRLLGSAPDAASWVDYTTEPLPTLHIGRRANLAEVTISVSPEGHGLDAAYTPLESVQVTERHDLVPSGVCIYYRRIDTINGTSYLRVFADLAPADADPAAENALVRTVELAGASYTATLLEQPVKVAPLSVYLAGEGVITPAEADAFAALSRFWKRKVGWLSGEGVEILSFRARARALTPTAGVVDEEGDEEEPEELDATLNNELMEGFITPWMEAPGLGRKGQDQTFTCEVEAVVVDADGAGTRRVEQLTAGVMATNCTTKTYRVAEAGEAVAPEPTPTGAAAAIYAAMSVVPIEGSCVVVDEECSLVVRPGKVLGLAGGRPGWATMRALVQGARVNIDAGRTEVTYGPPKQLVPGDVVDVMRANRLKKVADRARLRATGRL